MKEFKVGNSTLIIYSPLMEKTKEERMSWLSEEYEKGNPVLKGIEEIANRAYKEMRLRENTEK